MEEKKLKKPTMREQFTAGPEQAQQTQGDEQKAPMTKEEAMKFYEEEMPFMKLQDEYEKFAFTHEERKVGMLELRVRELEAVDYLTRWKAQMDEMIRQEKLEKERREQIEKNNEKMKADWEAMSPEQRQEYIRQAQATAEDVKRQAEQAEQKSEGFDHPLM